MTQSVLFCRRILLLSLSASDGSRNDDRGVTEKKRSRDEDNQAGLTERERFPMRSVEE
ncbi:MAG: hypothetical protein WB554_12325 [Desulfomonilaceae bacterium]